MSSQLAEGSWIRRLHRRRMPRYRLLVKLWIGCLEPLVSHPYTVEQAMEICEILVRSGVWTRRTLGAALRSKA